MTVKMDEELQSLECRDEILDMMDQSGCDMLLKVWIPNGERVVTRE